MSPDSFLKNFKTCKNFGTGLDLTLSSLSFLPLVPSLGFLTKVDDVYDATLGLRKLPFKDIERTTEVNKTLDRISQGKVKFKNDGTEFENREGLLPKDRKYLEYTVETPGVSHQGLRRIVQDETGKTYYSDDHYKNFIQIDPRRH